MSQAQIVLKAIDLTSKGDISSLRQLLQPSSPLGLELCLRILLSYLPQGTEPEAYIPLLEQLTSGPQLPRPAHDPPEDFDFIPQQEAGRRVHHVRLQPLSCHDSYFEEEDDPLVLFLVQQARKIDAGTGSLDQVRRLLEPFTDRSPALRTWMIARLLPLLRLEYEKHTDLNVLTMREFEKLEDREAIQVLLAGAKRKEDASNELRGLIVPWLQGNVISTRKRRKLSHHVKKVPPDHLARSEVTADENQKPDDQGWSLVNQWLLESSLHSFQYAVKTTTRWHGPDDFDFGDWAGEKLSSIGEDMDGAPREKFGQMCMALIYANNETSLDSLEGSQAILKQNAGIFNLDTGDLIENLPDLDESYIRSISREDLLYDSLLDSKNPLTVLSTSSVALLRNVLASTSRLCEVSLRKSCRNVLEIMLFGTQESQWLEFTYCLRNLKRRNISSEAWLSALQQIFWLHGVHTSIHISAQHHEVFGKIPLASIEVEIVSSLLESEHHKLASELYSNGDFALPADTIERVVLEAATNAYDAASHGNRARGGMKKASEIIATFRNQFPASEGFRRFTALLTATHSMSFYSLALQPGIPSRPADIRKQEDVPLLLHQILVQNPRSYTHLDDLIGIGQNLGLARFGRTHLDNTVDGLDMSKTEQLKTTTRRWVTRMAIEAALDEDDFDTAYSYVVNRLSISRKAIDEGNQSMASKDDVSWRGAYAAGRYPISNDEGSDLRRLEQGMELLSQALLLAPPSALAEILGVWQDCEQQMTQLSEQEAEAEKEADEGRAHSVPGDFSADTETIIQKPRKFAGRGLQEEAPMGLFDVAREVGSTLSKSAFPLRSASRPLGQGTGVAGDDSEQEAGGGEEGLSRVRKRDMVSDMVTGGLASGIGWVIGE